MLIARVPPNGPSTTLADSPDSSPHKKKAELDGYIITKVKGCLPVIGTACIAAAALTGGPVGFTFATAALACTSNALPKVAHTSNPEVQAPPVILDDLDDASPDPATVDGLNHTGSSRNNLRPELSLVEPFKPLVQELSSATGTIITSIFEYVSRSPSAYTLLDDPINSMLTHHCLEDLKSCLNSIFRHEFRTKCREFIVKEAEQGKNPESVKALFDAGYKPNVDDIKAFIEAGNRDIVLTALKNMRCPIKPRELYSLIFTAIESSDDISLALLTWVKEHNIYLGTDIPRLIIKVLESNKDELDNILTELLDLAILGDKLIINYQYDLKNYDTLRLEQQMKKAMQKQNESVVNFLLRNNIFPNQLSSDEICKFIINHHKKFSNKNYPTIYLESINKFFEHLKMKDQGLEPLILQAHNNKRFDIISMIKNNNLITDDKIANLIAEENNKSSWIGWAYVLKKNW